MSHIPRAAQFTTKSGKVHKFDTLDWSYAFFATEDPEALEVLSVFAKSNTLSIEEISKEKYEEEYLKKKPSSDEPAKPRWREELSPGSYAPDTVAPQVIKNPSATTQPTVSPSTPAPSDAAPAATEPKALETKTAPKKSIG